VRIGIALGPMEVALDLNGYPRIVGDGINVAERIAAFAKPGEVVVSRSFHDMISRLSEGNAALFTDGGARTDKNGREHPIYFLAAKGARPAPPPSRADRTPASPMATAGGGGLAGFLRDRLKVGFAATVLGLLIAIEIGVLALGGKPADGVPPVASVPAPSPAPEPVKVDPPKVAQPRPESPKAEAPKAEAPKAEPAKVEPPKVEAPRAVAAPTPPKPAETKREEQKPKREPPKPSIEPPKPAPEPPKPAPEPPREEPKVAVAPPTTLATPISKAPVEFPAMAYQRSIERGRVKARLTIDAGGTVRNVQIVEAVPRRWFDEEATRSLKLWRFNAGADNRSYDVEIEFQR
jgi:TonB family protein